MGYSITTKKSWAQTSNELEEEFNRWGVTDWETNFPKGARREGFMQTTEERTVTLRYVKNGKTVNLSYGKQARAVDNLRALYLTINDMRMTEVRGVQDLVESSYKQLGSGSANNTPIVTAVQTSDPYEFLGVTKATPMAVVEAAYRTLAKDAHPDNGGSFERMKRLNEAVNQIRREKQ